MSTQLQAPDSQEIERVLLTGDLSRLTPDQKLSYYNRVCESLDLNPLTKPFQYLKLNGKEILYASKDCTEQLRNKHTVSVRIMSREVVEGCYVVTAQAALPSGRVDESIGAVPIENLRGEARSNAMMKCETKAKRRVTLSICGLGMLDESEVDSIPGAMFPDQGSKETQQEVVQRRIADLTANKQERTAELGRILNAEPAAITEEDKTWGRGEATKLSTSPATIMELADSLDAPPEPPGGWQGAMKSDGSVDHEPFPKKAKKDKPPSAMTEAAKKRWLQAKMQLRAVRQDGDKFYYASIAPYKHCTEIPTEVEAREIWKVLQSGLVPQGPPKHDLTLQQELERHQREHPKFMDKLGAYGFSSIGEIIERATGAELGLLLSELRQR